MIDEGTYNLLVDIPTHLERIADALENIEDNLNERSISDGP